MATTPPTAIIGTGITLQYRQNNRWVTVTRLHEVKPPQLNRKEIEVTTHNEALTVGDAKITGMLRRGSVTGTLNWVPSDATHAHMLADFRANVLGTWRLKFPPATASGPTKHYYLWTFAARLSAFDIPNVTTDTPLQAKFTLTLDGSDTIEES